MIIHKQLKPSSFCFRLFDQDIYVRYFYQNMINYLKWWRINPRLKWIIKSLAIKFEVSVKITHNVSRYNSIEVKSAYNQADFRQGTFFLIFFLFLLLSPPTFGNLLHISCIFFLLHLVVVTWGGQTHITQFSSLEIMCAHYFQNLYYKVFYPFISLVLKP